MSTEMPLASVTVSSITYPGTAQVISGVLVSGFSFQNADQSATVYFSFDGSTDHGILFPHYNAAPSPPTAPVGYATTKQSVWFRLAAAGDNAKVYVMASG